MLTELALPPGAAYCTCWGSSIHRISATSVGTAETEPLIHLRLELE